MCNACMSAYSIQHALATPNAMCNRATVQHKHSGSSWLALERDFVVQSDTAVLIDGGGNILKAAGFQFVVKQRAQLCLYNLHLTEAVVCLTRHMTASIVSLRLHFESKHCAHTPATICFVT